MRNETGHDAPEPVRATIPAGEPPVAAPRQGATVSIPVRPVAATPFGATTLHARLALLRPRPVTLRPAARSDG